MILCVKELEKPLQDSEELGAYVYIWIIYSISDSFKVLGGWLIWLLGDGDWDFDMTLDN